MRSSWEEEYEKSKQIGTGGRELPEDCKEVTYPFDKYEIVVKLTRSNEFVGISEVRVNKDFLSYKQRTTAKGFHDVEEFYKK